MGSGNHSVVDIPVSHFGLLVPLSSARAKVSDPDMLSHILEQTIQQNCLAGKPGQILDESGMPLEAKSLKIVARKGASVSAVGPADYSCCLHKCGWSLCSPNGYLG